MLLNKTQELKISIYQEEELQLKYKNRHSEFNSLVIKSTLF